jgi:hypothetical protein
MQFKSKIVNRHAHFKAGCQSNDVFNLILQLKSRHGALDRVIFREPERSVPFVREHRIADKLL